MGKASEGYYGNPYTKPGPLGFELESAKRA
jgi:hypothetical protein